MAGRHAGTYVAAVAAVLALVGASCSGSGEEEIAGPTSTTSTAPVSGQSTTTTEATSLEQVVASRYIAFWSARLLANAAPPNPDAPALREHATGQQLVTVIAETARRRDEGTALRVPTPSVSDHRVRVMSVDGSRAEVQDCFVNDGVVYRPATGEVLDANVVTRNVTAVMVIVEGAWKLERTTVVQEWKGVAGCALGSSG